MKMSNGDEVPVAVVTVESRGSASPLREVVEAALERLAGPSKTSKPPPKDGEEEVDALPSSLSRPQRPAAVSDLPTLSNDERRLCDS